MTPIQQLYLGVGAKKKTYSDDVFSTYLYKGTNGANTLNTGLDMSGEGGLTWIKARSSGNTDHTLFDTVRGVNKKLRTDSTEAETTLSANQTFTSTGFTLNNTFTDINDHNVTYSSWNFRKAPGFFDIVTYTGNGSNRTIAHSLGCVPGMMLVKCTSETRNWIAYHGDLIGATGNLENAGTALMMLDTTEGVSHNDQYWNDTEPTSTHFSVGTQNGTNKNGATYVAYLFAGGESTAATARSVDFDGSSDYLSIASTSDFNFGTGDFTIEFWANYDDASGSNYILDFRTDGSNTGTTNQPLMYYTSSTGTLSYWLNGSARITGDKAAKGTWNHYAIVRNSGTTTLYMNGISQGTYSDSTNYPDSPLTIARRQSGGQLFNGKISNLRIVKGTAVYTSSFRPPTEPLTNITNTKLLCCNNSSTTGSTVTPGTITASGSPTASSDSPFDDPAAFTFGENGDQGIIKMGSYVGDGNNGSNQGVANSHEIFLGWEPQWILIKRSSGAESWILYDSMRGISNVSADSQDAKFEVNNTDAESLINHINLTSTGFTFTTGNNQVNASGESYVFVAIRRSDGYVGKPAEAGTSVFTMAYGNSGGTNPSYVSNFPVDFALTRQTATSEAWYAASRLTTTKYLMTNNTNAENTSSNFVFDHNNGWRDGSAVTNYLSWMWKRHAGFDVVTYKGSGTSAGEQQDIPHSMNKTPEMMWVKMRDGANQNWVVYHKGLNGGTNPEQYVIELNTTDIEDSFNCWDNTAPTATSFRVGNQVETNHSDYNYIAFLFSSVDGISKVGYFDGWNWPSTNTIECGFQPRFVVVKKVTGTGGNPRDWHVFDTVRGIANSNGNDALIEFNNSNASSTNTNYLELTSSGFSPKDGDIHSTSSDKFIFYAHA